MTSSRDSLRKRTENLLEEWHSEGIPPRWTLQNIALELLDWRKSQGIESLWESPPLMLTATLDDGWGHGIDLIRHYAEAVGLRVIFLGLLQPPEVIIDQCRKHSPALLGLTVLQPDSESALRYICDHLPPQTQLIVGGALFQIDPELAPRTGVQHVAKNVVDFLKFVLSFKC